MTALLNKHEKIAITGLVTPHLHTFMGSPLGNVVTRHHVAIRFVLTLSVVCNCYFQSPELRKHSGVGLKPCYNVADWLPLSLFNLGLLVSLQASSFRKG